MIEHGITPEYAAYAIQALGLMGVAMAFSHRQKEYIRDRDEHVCQAYRLHIPHNCNGRPDMDPCDRKNECHHIIPQRYAHVIGMETADFAENGILLCSNFHQGVIHPDMKVALQRYRGGRKDAFRQVGVDRNALLNEGAIYWNQTYDRLLSTRAIQLTQRLTRRGRNFPEK